MPAINVFNSLYKAQDHIITLHVKYALIQTKGMKSAEGAVYEGGGETTSYLCNDLFFTGGWLEKEQLLFFAVINSNI